MRNKDKLVTPSYRLQKVNKFYNGIPRYVLNLPLQKFKVIVKTMLIRKAYTVQEYSKGKKCFKLRSFEFHAGQLLLC